MPLQFDMQQLSLDELKQVLFHAFRDHLTMKDIENIIITEEESLNETSGNCPEYEGGEEAVLEETFEVVVLFQHVLGANLTIRKHINLSHDPTCG